MVSNLSGTELFSDNFASGLLSGWDIVDESEEGGLASWVIQVDGMLIQGANTLSYAGSDIAKLGTYILHSLEDKVAS